MPSSGLRILLRHRVGGTAGHLKPKGGAGPAGKAVEASRKIHAKIVFAAVYCSPHAVYWHRAAPNLFLPQQDHCHQEIRLLTHLVTHISTEYTAIMPTGKAAITSHQRTYAHMSGRPRVYFDINIGDRSEGRIVFELVSPYRSLRNFR